MLDTALPHVGRQTILLYLHECKESKTLKGERKEYEADTQKPTIQMFCS